MRCSLFALAALFLVVAGCSSGPTLSLPDHSNELEVERLVVVSDIEQFDLSDDQVVTSNVLDMHIEAREIIAETFELTGDTVSAYKAIVLDTLLARVVERLDVEDLRVASPDRSVELTRMRVRGHRRPHAWAPPASFVSHLYVPRDSSHYTFDGYSPDYVLILTELEVGVQGGNVMGSTMGMPGMNRKERLSHRVAFVLWDNQAAEVRTAGYAYEDVEKEGGLLRTKKFTREGVEKSLVDLADKLVRDSRLPTK